ncbi:helix-turn-helix transcriptional regulator [Konateibacter massiliensis]|uniref:helix-turn-helix transcriptional regulator n=1 Tax=Konateibacter massiliensis TaxID=2002841 RepID=UPI000C155167|nr:AraC family transcriptional regulator [Konateibacter massiliensis]
MKGEFEIIQSDSIKSVNLLFNKIKYRSPHMHKEFELVYNLGCEAIFHVGTMRKSFQAGSYVIFNPNQVHEIEAAGQNPFMICLQIAPEFFENVAPYISYLEFDSFYLAKYENDRLHKLMFELSNAYLCQGEHYSLECAALVYQIFKELLEEFPYHITTELEKKSNEEKALRLKRILRYAKNHYMEKISLKSLAKEENLSLNYLSRFIKENLNRSFQEYIGELRFNQAKYLIRNTNKSLLEICQECGYSDYRYLYQVFMKHYECSPKQYRSLSVQEGAVAAPDSIETKLFRQEALEMIRDKMKLKTPTNIEVTK